MQTVYDIEHRCGHVTQVHLGHVRTSQRAWRAERMASDPCPECVTAAAAERRTAGDAEAAATSAADGLPALVGTPKQVTWAESIRREHLDWFAARQDGSKSGPAAADLTALRAQTDAAFWIHHRGSPWRAYEQATGAR